MTNKKKGSERLKVQEDVAIAAPKAKAVLTQSPIRRRETPAQHSEYEIIKGGGVVFLLSQKGVTYFDETTKSVNEIRYCPNEPSIYRDEQSDKALKSPVAFREGKLFVPKEKPNLMAYLDRHPQNVSNGGSVFRKVDKKQDASKEMEQEFVINDAITMVREKDINQLLPSAIYFGININKPVAEIRYDLLRLAKKNPKGFIDSFDSPQVRARSIVQQAKDFQMLKVSENGCYWFDSNKLIVSVAAGLDPMDVMTRFCLTEKGAGVYSILEDKLSKLS